MDEVKIVSKFTTNMLSKVLGALIRKKTECDVSIHINGVSATIDKEKVHVHLDVDAEFSKADAVRLLNETGLF